MFSRGWDQTVRDMFKHKQENLESFASQMH